MSESLLSATNLSAISGTSGLTAWTNSYTLSNTPKNEVEITGYTGTVAFAIFAFPSGDVRYGEYRTSHVSGTIQFSTIMLTLANTGSDHRVTWPFSSRTSYSDTLYSRIYADGRLCYQMSYENGDRYFYISGSSFTVILFTV